MILEAEKQGAGGLANDIVRHDIAVLPWNVLNVGQDGVPFLYDPKRKKNAQIQPPTEQRGDGWHTHTHLSRADDDGGGASTSDFLRDRLSDNRFVRGLLGLASGRGVWWNAW